VLFVLAAAIAWRDVAAQDLVHDISDVVKKVDKGTKTVLMKTADGTEHTIKYTDKTTLAATMAL
jgi:ATP-dependent RNA circularization protein (DNA/RNA ligase family)